MGEYYGVRMKDDPNGEYLQHWGVPKGFMREGHKYLARLVTPSGYRYLYTQAQVAAAKAGKAIGNAIGLNQRNRAQQATARAQRISGGNKGREQSVQGIKRARMAKATAKRAQSAYNKTLLGRAEKAFNSARKGISDAVDTAGKQANQLYKTAKNVPANADRALRNAIGNTAIMKRIDRAQRNKKAAGYKQRMLDRTDYNDRRNSAINSAARAGSRDGHGSRNPGTTRLKDMYNAERYKKRMRKEPNRSKAYAENRERVQQGKTESLRGNTNTQRFGGRPFDAFNKDRPVSLKSKKARNEQSTIRNARGARTKQRQIDAKQPTGSAKGKPQYAWTRTPPETREWRNLRPQELERRGVSEGLRDATDVNTRRRLKNRIKRGSRNRARG